MDSVWEMAVASESAEGMSQVCPNSQFDNTALTAAPAAQWSITPQINRGSWLLRSGIEVPCGGSDAEKIALCEARM